MTVTLARAQLSWLGVVDDPLAHTLLSRPFAVLHSALQRRPFRRLTRTPTLSFLAARTRFFDDALTTAVEQGASQVVIVGAGYDSRAWRFARPGVQFFEIDHPATQADKRERAPLIGAPAYVAADLRDSRLSELLPSAGFDASARTVFIVEGLTMYLDEPAVATLLGDLAVVAADGSRLAVNFTVSGGGSVAPVSRAAAKVIRTLWRSRGEPIINWVRPGELTDLFARAGWSLDELTPAPELAQRYLNGSPLPLEGLSPGALIAAATKRS